MSLTWIHIAQSNITPTQLLIALDTSCTHMRLVTNPLYFRLQGEEEWMADGRDDGDHRPATNLPRKQHRAAPGSFSFGVVGCLCTWRMAALVFLAFLARTNKPSDPP
eukprot:m.74792 g.74792  ORF g.74792 m.74792 type:complete len:107 (-) comp10341_c0_seq3:163-483(-)